MSRAGDGKQSLPSCYAGRLRCLSYERAAFGTKGLSVGFAFQGVGCQAELATECRSPTIHFGLGDLVRTNAAMHELVSLSPWGAYSFAGPLFQVPTDGRTYDNHAQWRASLCLTLRYADRANNCGKRNERYCAVVLHQPGDVESAR